MRVRVDDLAIEQLFAEKLLGFLIFHSTMLLHVVFKTDSVPEFQE
jgi:hypothetical protein